MNVVYTVKNVYLRDRDRWLSYDQRLTECNAQQGQRVTQKVSLSSSTDFHGGYNECVFPRVTLCLKYRHTQARPQDHPKPIGHVPSSPCPMLTSLQFDPDRTCLHYRGTKSLL